MVPIRLIELDEVDSTNLHARRLIESGDRGPFAVRARVQHAGRGRLGRSWASPEGGVWLTVAHPTLRSPTDCEPLPLLAALVVHGSIESLLPTEHRGALRIKWPNDILHAERKLAGILCERVTAGGAAWTLVGVGLNADIDVERLGPTLRRPVSLRGLCPGQAISPATIGSAVAGELGEMLADFEHEGLPRGAMQALADRLAWLDQPVVLHRTGAPGDRDRPDHPVCTGTLAGVDERGRAVIRTERGIERAISGELDAETLRLEHASTHPPGLADQRPISQPTTRGPQPAAPASNQTRSPR